MPFLVFARRVGIPLLAAVAWAIGSPFLHAAPAATDPAVELPTITVEEKVILPKPESWRYARIEGFEVLSNASDRSTAKLLRDFQRFHQALVMAWPAADIHSAVPASLIFCGRKNAFDAFRAKEAPEPEAASVSLSLRDAEMAAIVIDLETTSLNLMTPEAVASLAASAGDSSESGPTGIPEFAIDHYQQLFRAYVRFILAQMRPRLPAWAEEGVAQIFMRMEFTPTLVRVGKLEDPRTSSATRDTVEDRDFNVALQRRALMPMNELLAVDYDSPVARNPIGSRWASQSYAFVHFCLYGNKGKFQKPFFTFLQRIGAGPATEAVFKECFGMSYKELNLQLRLYADYAIYRASEIRPAKGGHFSEFPSPAFRDASPAEIGRIKGEALRLAGNQAAAHLELIAPYIRGERDPALLASLGLYERSVGENARAQKFLEAATAAKVQRPRAYLELARLRYDEAIATAPGEPKQLSETAMRAVLQPLFTARSQPPPLPEVYELIALAWSRSALMPTAANLEVIDEGVRHFPQRLEWLYQAAQVKAQYGFTEGAAAIAALGGKMARDPADRERFKKLESSFRDRPGT